MPKITIVIDDHPSFDYDDFIEETDKQKKPKDFTTNVLLDMITNSIRKEFIRYARNLRGEAKID